MSDQDGGIMAVRQRGDLHNQITIRG